LGKNPLSRQGPRRSALTAAEPVEGLYGCGVFTAAELRAIDRDNIAGLLPQYAD
jgi:hypothetical protein